MDGFMTKLGLGPAEFSIAAFACPPDARPPVGPHFHHVFCVRLSNDLIFPESIHSALGKELRHYRNLTNADHWFDNYGHFPTYERDVLPNHDFFRVEDRIRIPNPRNIYLTKAFQNGRLWDFDATHSSKEQWLCMLRVLGNFDLTLFFDLLVSHPGEFLVGLFVL